MISSAFCSKILNSIWGQRASIHNVHRIPHSTYNGYINDTITTILPTHHSRALYSSALFSPLIVTLCDPPFTACGSQSSCYTNCCIFLWGCQCCGNLKLGLIDQGEHIQLDEYCTCVWKIKIKEMVVRKTAIPKVPESGFLIPLLLNFPLSSPTPLFSRYSN